MTAHSSRYLGAAAGPCRRRRAARARGPPWTRSTEPACPPPRCCCSTTTSTCAAGVPSPHPRLWEDMVRFGKKFKI